MARRRSRARKPDPTPENLRSVLGFLNTRDLDTESDELADTATLSAWLSRHDLLRAGSTVDESDRRRAVELREALRTLVRANLGVPVDDKALELLNRELAEVRYRVRLDPDGTPHRDLLAATGWPGAALWILDAILKSMADKQWSHVKLCPGTTCRQAFYDPSRNRSGKWCLERRCGDPIFARRYRQRHPNG